MKDTDLHSSSRPSGPQAVLDADRFFSALIVPPQRHGRSEGTLLSGPEGRVYFSNYDIEYLERREDDFMFATIRESADNGRTWSAPSACLNQRGGKIKSSHITIFRLSARRLGMVSNDHEQFRDGPPGRDGGTKITFRASNDEGRTWSDPVLVYPLNALCCSGHAMLLSSGRILVPGFRWISHDASPNSEMMNAPSLSYSFACFSDDGGATWRVGHSQLFISHHKFACDLEEPTVVELKDGRLLAHLRSQVGRPFRSYSMDGGLTWSRPEPLPMAASYTPSVLRRMPSGEILMVWNQSSRGEILKGLHRHRLSCAISRDEGQTWTNFKNLESLDDRAVIEPPPLDRWEIIEQWEDYGYHQPSDKEHYPHVPGALRICYPDVLFHNNEALIVYDYGEGAAGRDHNGIKLRAIPLDWFTQ